MIKMQDYHKIYNNLSKKERKLIDQVIDNWLFKKEKNSLLDAKNILNQYYSEEECLIFLACAKSTLKYGYNLRMGSIKNILKIARKNTTISPLISLIQNPYLLAKISWIYDHIPYFIFNDDKGFDEIEKYILTFASDYQEKFLKFKPDVKYIKPNPVPFKLFSTTFWDRRYWDPCENILDAYKNNHYGIELALDFHPFNPLKLLPEDINTEKRKQIRNVLKKTGLKLAIHAPIVGPYHPFPNAKKGKQLFFEPAEQIPLMTDTVKLADDIGASHIVAHLINPHRIDDLIKIVKFAEDTNVRVTIENYCNTKYKQTSAFFLSVLEDIKEKIPSKNFLKNFGITYDVGHSNIEGEDPVVVAAKITHWCKKNKTYLRVHGTDNYGKLLFSPPHYSADVHGNISGRGIYNELIIKMIRAIGLEVDVVVEQISPITQKDLELIDRAQNFLFTDNYSAILEKGKKELSALSYDPLITKKIKSEEAYQFMVGIEGLNSLREHLIYRRIQDSKALTTEEALKTTSKFMKIPDEFKVHIVDYIDELLEPVLNETGRLEKKDLDLICQNVSGAIFGSLNRSHLESIFAVERHYKKDEDIFLEGSTGTEMFFIKSGEVGVYVNKEKIAVLGVCEIFGEMSLFYDIKRTATCRAEKEDTIIGVLDRITFNHLINEDSDYSRSLIFCIYRFFPQRLRNLNEKFKSVISTLYNFIENPEEKKRIMDKLNERIFNNKILNSRLLNVDLNKIFTTKKYFNKGEVIFNEGDPGDGIYYIFKGKVKVASRENGKDIILGILNEKEFFGEMA
ncbi:MAG: cyclic nucleotide-binding domain-containing protein, partial [Thermodesulfobacteriota bacterium]|nr:cyclic nucleotide-binding domain-containing protein [Thermodesulfobacteriota bacterium]